MAETGPDTSAPSPPLPAPGTLQLPAAVQALVWLALQQVREFAIVLLDADARVLAWPPAARDMFGWLPGDIIGHPLDILFTPEDRALGAVGHELVIADATGRGENDRWLMRRDGTRVWINGATTPLRDDAGRILGYCKIMRERTDLKTWIDNLEGRFEAAQSALDRTQLFAATLAHELRNPLGALGNSLEIIRLSAGEDVRVRKAMEIYDRQLAAMRRLLDDVTDTVRAEKGKLALDLRPMDVNELVSMAAATCGPRAQEKSLHLQTLPLPVKAMVMADAVRMQQVLMNLLVNAVKYTPAGGHIWLKVSTEDDEAVIRVMDTGIGLSREALPRVFELFTQVHEFPDGSPLTGAGTGEGLGLALVRQLVELHDGKVQARSGGPNQGSEFTVRLPIHQLNSGGHARPG